MSWLFCLLVGSLFVVRTNKILEILGYTSPWRRRFALLIALAVTILASWMSRAPHFVVWMFALALFLSPKLTFRLIQHRRRREFQTETSRFYDQMLLGVRSGVSPREILRRISQDRSFGFHTRDLSEACLRDDAVLLETQTRDFRHRAEQLRKILSAGQRSTERLSALCRESRMRDRFQRKSRNATQPVRAQIAVILSLYMGLLAFQWSQDRGILYSGWFFVSFVLMSLGLGLIERLQRSFRWKS